MKIRPLPPDVASKIAAGEVIERPASVLKELLENSLDAGASSISVEVLSAGRKLLRVSDDGAGMEPADCRAAFERHATSKIGSLEDLDRLASFGFRGEALFSVAAVSKVSLTSAARGSRKGWRVDLSGGRLVSEREAPPVEGATIEVVELFFNTPARLKFLKSDSAEKSGLARVFEEAALANPEAGFAYKSEGRASLRFAPRPGGSEDARRERIRDVLGGELADGMLFASAARPGLKLDAFVSPADNLSATRNFQFVFVNKRPVASRLVQQALYRAYEPFRDKNRHPAAVLFLEAPPDRLDVNVHPTKREVRFKDERDLFELVTGAISKALLDSRGIPTLSGANEFPRRMPAAPDKPAVLASPDHSFLGEPSSPYRAAPKPLSSYGEAPLIHARRDVAAPWFPAKPRYIGQIEKTYLIFEAEGGLVVVDQHAAQERVLFERYLGQLQSGGPKVQKLMLPITVELPASEIHRVLGRKDRLDRAGFELEPFGKTTLQVVAVPTVFSKSKEIKEMVHRLLDTMLSGPAAAADTRYDAAATIACKAAVKAHDPLSEKEALALMEDLSKCQDGSRCPHGRPALLRLTRDELARRFQRPGAPPL